jgi:hypothetical protein
MFYTIQDLVKLDFKKAFGNKDRLGRVAFALSDAVLMILFFGFIRMLIQAFKEDFGEDSIGYDLLRFSESVSTKVLNEQNLFDNTLGAIKTEPAFFTYSTRFANDLGDLFMGDKTIRNFLSKNVKMFEFINPE